MHSLTRSLSAVNSPQSRILVATPLLLRRRRHPTGRSLAVSSSFVSCRHTRRQFSASPSPNKASSFTSTSRRHPLSLAMDSNSPHSPEPEASSAAAAAASDSAADVEDFVHVDDASPNHHRNLEASVVSMDEEGDDASTIATAAAEDDPIPSPNVHSLEGSVASVDLDRGANESENFGAVDDQRKGLPEELSRSVMMLSCESSADGGNCDVYLVGTAHVSTESCQEVHAVISYLKPQVVFLELCSSRVAVLTPQNLKVPTMGEMIDMWNKKHNLFGILYSWFLAKVANKLEVFPGAEFRVAFDEAMKYGGKVILGDRPVQITLKRTWTRMPLWHKTKLMYSLLFQAFFLPSPEDLSKMLKEMDDVDMLTLVIQEMSKEFPTLMETLVHERDQYMSHTLHEVASEHSSVVAVVGKGHLQGIKRNWKLPVEVRDLLEMPSKKSAISVVKVLTSLGVAAAGLALISGIYISRRK